MDEEQIGAMNGPWALLLKIALSTYPVMLTALVGWGSWITANQFIDNTSRANIQAAISDINARLSNHESAGGHQTMQVRVSTVERNQLQILNKLDNIIIATTELRTEIKKGGG